MCTPDGFCQLSPMSTPLLLGLLVVKGQDLGSRQIMATTALFQYLNHQPTDYDSTLPAKLLGEQ